MNYFLSCWLTLSFVCYAWQIWIAERKRVDPAFWRLLVTLGLASLNLIAAYRLWGAP